MLIARRIIRVFSRQLVPVAGYRRRIATRTVLSTVHLTDAPGIADFNINYVQFRLPVLAVAHVLFTRLADEAVSRVAAHTVLFPIRSVALVRALRALAVGARALVVPPARVHARTVRRWTAPGTPSHTNS